MKPTTSRPYIGVKPPGPKTRALLRSTGDSLDPFPPIWGIPARNQDGPWIEDVDGNVYLDFVSGKCVANLGHRHPAVISAVKEQIEHVVLGATENRFLLAEKLAELTPGRFPKSVFFGSSGSDSVDGALKLARWSTGKPNILCVSGAYHGQTYGALSVSSTWNWMVRGFHPLSGVHHLPPPYCYRCSFKLSYPSCGLQCLRFLTESMFPTHCPPEDIAAVIIEPIFGDMGWVIPPDEYFQELKKLSETYGFLFIADEVQTGFGRTGKWMAMNHLGVVPDIVCLGKPIASGFPLSAMVARKDLTTARGLHFHQSYTLEANAPACAASLATIRVIEEENLLRNCTELGKHLSERLLALQRDHSIIGDVRGRGLLATIEIVKNTETREPGIQAAKTICRLALENGLYTMFMGAFETASIRIAPPLNSTPEIIDLGVRILDKSLSQTEKILFRNS